MDNFHFRKESNMNPQYGILRFAKYKGPEIGRIEAHNERTKETYASNPDVDKSRSHLNIHLITPKQSYRAEAERQIAEAGCRTRSDSVRVVEALITASPEFFKGKKSAEVREYFELALRFIEKNQSKETILSAVVHMDEKTPHMHLCFVPLTEDKRLCAKEIIGNRKHLTLWQDGFWKTMVQKYPDLERGESASKTGRAHVPPRLFKEAYHLDKMRERILQMLKDVNLFNKKEKVAQVEKLINKYVLGEEKLQTELRRYDKALQDLTAEQKSLKRELAEAKGGGIARRLEEATRQKELEELRQLVGAIPPEILEAAKRVAKYKAQER